MPEEGLNIYFTVTDQGSMALSRIGDKTKALDKETQALEQSFVALGKANDVLNKKKAELEKQLVRVNKEVKDAKKQFGKLGDAVSGDAFTKARQQQQDLQTELKHTNEALQENERIFKQNMETVRKSSLGGGSSSQTDGIVSIAKGLIGGQLGQMLASSLGGAAEARLSSAIGLPEASLISDILSSTIAGAAMGSIVPGIGTAIGAAVGAISGYASGKTKIFQAEDNAFKEYYAGLYDDVNAETEDMIGSGSTIAGGREQTRMAFIKRLGNDEAADAYLERVKTMAASTNYDYDEITGYSKLLLNTYDPDEVFGVLQSLSDATAGLSLTSSDVNVMIQGLSRMRTTGKTTQEYLNYFSERGVDVYEALSTALGVDKSKIAGMVTAGDISGSVSAQAILDYIDRTYGGLSEDLMSTYDAMTANLEDIMANLEAQGGEGYNEMRKAGLAAEQEAYGGALGEAVGALNRLAGENKAYLENLSEQYHREALAAVLLGEETTLYSAKMAGDLKRLHEEYSALEAAAEAGDRDAALRMEAIGEDARALATQAYESSDPYQKKLEEELTELAAIREHTAGTEAILNSYKFEQEKSKGEKGTASHKAQVIAVLNAAAGEAGMNYPYSLSQQGFNVTVTGNQFAGTSEEMPNQVAEVIMNALVHAATTFNLG